MPPHTLAERLRALIGQPCTFYDRPCRVVEVLPDGDCVVLAASDALPPVQVDQYGQATHRAAELIEVPLHGDDGRPSEDLLHLLEGVARPPTADTTG